MEHDPVEAHLRQLTFTKQIPENHVKYLYEMRDVQDVKPKVIYDIGASTLHWTNEAKQVWPDSKIICFEAMEACEFLYKESNVAYTIATLGDCEREVEFYENYLLPSGNSYYRENEEVNPGASMFFNDSNKKIKKLVTLDDVVDKNNYPFPDLIKIDVQGAEMDVLKGAQNVLKNCKHLILELQHVQYNKGAPLHTEMLDYCKFIGFDLVTPLFSNNGPDGDYHFIRND